MGKASSSKKVARAARAGSVSKGPERKELGFPLAVAVTILLGSALVLYARSDEDTVVEPRIGTSWFAAYGIYNCDKWEPPLAPSAELAQGITFASGFNSATGGVIRINPASDSVAGTRATLGVLFDSVGATVSNSKIEFPGGPVLDGDAKCGDKDAELKIVRYDAADSSAEGETITNNFDNKRFRKDREAFVFALVPEGAPVPRPDAETLAKLDEAVTSGGIEPATGSTGSTGQVAPTTTAAAPTTTAGS